MNVNQRSLGKFAAMFFCTAVGSQWPLLHGYHHRDDHKDDRHVQTLNTPAADNQMVLVSFHGYFPNRALGTHPHLTLTSYVAFGKTLNDSEPQPSLLGQGY